MINNDKDNVGVESKPIENLLDDITSGSCHLPNGRQARTIVLENHPKNINIDECDDDESLLNNNDAQDIEAMMFMINENLS